MTKDLTPEQAKAVMKIQLTLGTLGVQGIFQGIEPGPVLTGYYYTLTNTPIAKIMGKTEDIALGLGEDKVTIQRIGEHLVIFVANEDRQNIDFKENLHWICTDPEVRKMHIPIPVGIDTQGKKSAFDLTEMPHLMIAGSTNAGKSVFESNIISTNVYFSKPEDLFIYLVDTKGLDLPLFRGLPHVKGVATTVDEFTKMGTMLMAECRVRLKQLQGASCQNIRNWHGLGLKMPYILVMLDEFADLADLDKLAREHEKDLAKAQERDSKFDGIPTVKQWLNAITRISRAAGIHIIACTQRSSVKVIDGDIKANFPARIALRLPTGIDSRTILGTNGAENLLGKGDMLVQRPNEDALIRYHGPFVSMKDIGELVTNYEYVKDMFTVKV